MKILEGCTTCHPELADYMSDEKYEAGVIMIERGYINADEWDGHSAVVTVPGNMAKVRLNGVELYDCQAVMQGKWALRLSEPIRMCDCRPRYEVEGEPSSGVHTYVDEDDYRVIPNLIPIPR